MFYDVYIKLCEDRKLSPSKAAEIIGLNRAAVVKWRKGATPNGETLNKIADYFKVSTDYLLGKETQKEKPVLDISTTRLMDDDTPMEPEHYSPTRPSLDTEIPSWRKIGNAFDESTQKLKESVDLLKEANQTYNNLFARIFSIVDSRKEYDPSNIEAIIERIDAMDEETRKKIIPKLLSIFNEFDSDISESNKKARKSDQLRKEADDILKKEVNDLE